MNSPQSRPDVLVFDSRIGGRSVHAALKEAAPDIHSIVIEDRAGGAPYDARLEADVRARSIRAIAEAVEQHNPRHILLACVSASLCAVDALRAQLQIPVHPTLPPLAEASRLTCTHHVALLGHPAALAHPVTQRQIALFAERGLRIAPLSCPDLADTSERYVREGRVPDLRALEMLMAPVREDVRIDTVILSSPTYSPLRGLLQKAAFRPLYWVDGAAAVAKRFLDSMGGAQDDSAARA